MLPCYWTGKCSPGPPQTTSLCSKENILVEVLGLYQEAYWDVNPVKTACSNMKDQGICPQSAPVQHIQGSGDRENECVGSSQDPAKENHTKLVQLSTCNVRTSATKNKLEDGSNWGLLAERHSCTFDIKTISLREICCLPGAHIHGITKRLLSLVKQDC